MMAFPVMKLKGISSYAHFIAWGIENVSASLHPVKIVKLTFTCNKVDPFLCFIYLHRDSTVNILFSFFFLFPAAALRNLEIHSLHKSKIKADDDSKKYKKWKTLNKLSFFFLWNEHDEKEKSLLTTREKL